MNLSPHDIEINAITLLISFLDGVIRGFLKGSGFPSAVILLYAIAGLAGIICVLFWVWQYHDHGSAVSPSPTPELTVTEEVLRHGYIAPEHPVKSEQQALEYLTIHPDQAEAYFRLKGSKQTLGDGTK